MYYDISGCFFDSLRQFSCTEILPFPPEQDPALHTAMLGVADISLTEAQHAAHLQHVLSLLETDKNYELVLSDGIVPHTAILAKQNVGVLMVNTKPPYCAFAFDKQNMVEAFGIIFRISKKIAEQGVDARSFARKSLTCSEVLL